MAIYDEQERRVEAVIQKPASTGTSGTAISLTFLLIMAVLVGSAWLLYRGGFSGPNLNPTLPSSTVEKSTTEVPQTAPANKP